MVWLVVLLGVITSALSILSHVQLWQRKEYRWDRMRAYLLSPEARQLLLSVPAAASFTALLAVLAYSLNFKSVAAVLSSATLLLFLVHHGWRTYHRGIFRPVFTLKAKLIILECAVIVGVLIGLGHYLGMAVSVVWAVVLVVQPLLTAGLVGLTNVPAYVRKRYIITRARQLRERSTRLTVVGITGSFGKTSTKHFAWQLVRGHRPDVAATSRHRNSEIGVAQDMLERLTESTGVYIAEMGAYRRGEIKALAELTQPQIGVITAIGTQHLDLFGSQEKLAAAKWELIDALPGDGVAVLNADDAQLQSKAAGLTLKTIWYATSAMSTADVLLHDWKIEPTQIVGQLRIGEFNRAVTIPLLSEAMLSSAVAAAAIAHALGMSPEKIAAGLATLQPMPRTMELKRGRAGCTVIDDSYSANEHGVLTAVQHVTRFAQPRMRIVLVPLIEVGVAGTAIHERIGAALARSQAQVYLYGRAYAEDIKRGMQTATERLHVFTDPRVLADTLAREITADDVVLLEGRVPALVRTIVTAL